MDSLTSYSYIFIKIELRSVSNEYKIRFSHGVTESFYDLNIEEYKNLKETLKYQYFLTQIEKAYELIVHNYRDYEKNNFSIILNYLLKTSGSSSMQPIVNSIDRHISNILTSTYLYTSLLRIKRKDTKANDYSFENSTDFKEIYNLKSTFQKTTNKYHSTNYEYTFMSALRHKLNHGGDLSKITTLGYTWSPNWVNSESNKNLIVAKKDKRFSELDMKVLKEEAKKIIDNQKHFNAIKAKLPDTFYLRNAIRIYINLLSFAHAELRESKNIALETSNNLINKYLSKATNSDYGNASIIKYENTVKQEEMNLFSYFENISETATLLKAPLDIEHYDMPGEYEKRTTRYK